MTRVKIRHGLEVTTNLCVVLVCVFVIRTLLHRDRISSYAAVPQQVALKVGGPFTVNLPLDHSRETLVLALSAHCKFCAASVPFYSRLLVASKNGTQGLPIVAIFPNDQSEVQTFAARLGPSLKTVAGQDFQSLGIYGTPTLVLLDNTGRIRRVWTGELSSKDEQAVLKTVQTGT